MSGSTIRIVPQGELLRGTPEPPALELPERASCFAERAARLAALAAGHPDGAYLRLMQRLAAAQHAVLSGYPQPPLPDAEQQAMCQRHGLPLLAKNGARDGAWRSALAAILDQFGVEAPAQVKQVIGRLRAASPQTLETMGDAVLNLDYPELEAAAVPFLAAALQVDWVARATALGSAAFAKPEEVTTLCPVCGSVPVAALLKLAPVPGVRYLRCVLCCTDWQFPRGLCIQCQQREQVAYFHIEGGRTSIKAEACERCHGYIKVFSLEAEPQIEPVADDLGSLALDILMDESGYQRSSPNFLFVPGQS